MEIKGRGGGGWVKWARTAVLRFSQSEETEEVSPKYPKVAFWSENTDVV